MQMYKVRSTQYSRLGGEKIELLILYNSNRMQKIARAIQSMQSAIYTGMQCSQEDSFLPGD